MKKITGLFLCLLIALSAVVFPATASAATAINKTVSCYKSVNLTFNKAESAEYDCKVKNNDKKYIKLEAQNEGEYYWLMVYGLKATKSEKPLITITDKKDGKKVKQFQITVNKVKTFKHSNEKINKGVWKEINIKNPYEKNHEFSYNKKIIKFEKGGYGYGNGNWKHYIKGLKKGTTTVKVKLKNTKTVLSSFKVTVGNYKMKIKKAYKNTNLKYNKHLKKSYYLSKGGSINLGKAVQNFHSNSKISVKIKNKSLLKTVKVKKDKYTPEAVKLYAAKTGKTKVDVYEKRGKAKKTKIGTISVKVTKAKDADVFDANRKLDNDGIFYGFLVKVGDKINLKKIVTDKYINGPTGSKYKNSEYKFSFTASPANVVSVNKSTGIFTILSDGNNKVGCTITFADGSKASCGGSFDIEND